MGCGQEDFEVCEYVFSFFDWLARSGNGFFFRNFRESNTSRGLASSVGFPYVIP